MDYPDPKFAAQLERQLQKDGLQSILKSQRTLERRLKEHAWKLAEAKYQSHIAAEIATFLKQIETIEMFLQQLGYTE